MNYKTIHKATEMELVEMLKGSREDSELAFAEIYNRYSQKIYAYCLRQLGNADDAKDVFQEVFINFYNAKDNIIKTTSLNSLIYKISHNLCVNFQKKIHKTYSLDEVVSEYSTESAYEQQELLEMVAQALDVLDNVTREVFILRQYQGLSYLEIEAIMGINASTLKSCVWRAKEKLRSVLEPLLNDNVKLNRLVK